MEIFNRPYLNIKIDNESALIQLQWTGFAISQDFRNGLDVALDAVNEYSIEFWLADLREMTAILTNDEKWVNEVWFPKTLTTGLIKMAIVESSDYFNKTSVDRIMDAADSVIPYSVSYFRELEEAKNWLLENEVKTPLS